MKREEVGYKLCAVAGGLELVADACRDIRDGVARAHVDGIVWALEAALRDLNEARSAFDDLADIDGGKRERRA